jgi:hypothetical protein
LHSTVFRNDPFDLILGVVLSVVSAAKDCLAVVEGWVIQLVHNDAETSWCDFATNEISHLAKNKTIGHGNLGSVMFHDLGFAKTRCLFVF